MEEDTMFRKSGGSALLLVGLACAVIPLAGAQAQQVAHVLISRTATTGASFDECLRRSEATLRKEGFNVQRGSNTISGTSGAVSAQIICVPGNIHVTIVVGPDPDTAEAL
jgi:hypothetical protein